MGLRAAGFLLWDLLWPPVCVLCAGGAAGEFGLCVQCRPRLDLLPVRGRRCEACGRPSSQDSPSPRDSTAPAELAAVRCPVCAASPPPFDRAASSAVYRGAARELLARFKFARDLAAATSLLDLLDRSAAMLEREFDVIVPVPSHPRRERVRRFAPVRLLAREMGDRARRPVRDRWLARVRAGAPQGSAEVRSRAANVRGAFASTGHRAWFAPVSPRGLRVLLVDDVFTSGSTARECSRALRRAGAARVFVATVARGGLGAGATLAPAETRPCASSASAAQGFVARWEGDADCIH